MKRSMSALFLLWLGAAPLLAANLEEIRQQWHAANYAQVISELLQYRDTDFGKTIEVDYMLATSFCRHPGDDDLGRAFLLNILQVYELSSQNRSAIHEELTVCPDLRQPHQLAFLSSRSTGGGDAGVRGKMFYFVDGPNRAIGGDPLQARGEIPATELQARLFKLGDSGPAATAMDQRLRKLGYQPAVYASPHFVIGSVSNHSDADLQEIGRLLERALDFFVATYEVRRPANFISVYLVPDGRQMRTIGDKLHALEVAQGTIGYSFRNDLSVTSVVQGPFTGTLKHELTHLLVRSNFGDIPPWLDEGLAALYEVSRLEGEFLRGLPNWRGEILKRYWHGQPPVAELLGMNWQQLDAEEGSMERQAVHHALARYWVLYLQDRDYLAAVYNQFRTRDIRQVTANPGADATRLIETASGRSLPLLAADFGTWLERLSRPLTNADVADVQRRLSALGYSPGRADGLLGSNTIAAVKAFQRDNQLDENGQIDTVLIDLIKAKTGK